MGTALAIVGTVAAGFAGFFALIASFMRATRKGYQPGTVTAVTIVGMCAGFLIDDSTSLDGGLLSVAAPIFFLVPPSVALWLLPRRKPRRIFAVRRVRFPYARIGQAIFVTGCGASVVLAPLSWWTGGPVSLALVILVVGPILGLRGKQLFTTVLGQPVRAVPSFADVLAADPRPPVVFMRAFEREGQAFVFDDIVKYGRYSSAPRISSKQHDVLISLDEYLKGSITRRIGPFLALGNPQDYFTPAGAVRAYFKDETWMEEFRELAQRAGCLLVEAGESSNLRWELQYLKQSNLHHKLVVVTGHPSHPFGSPWLRLAARLAGIPPVSWDGFATTLTDLGYELPAGEPEFGSVIGFDAAARPHLLTSGADLPEQFVEPMAAWLSGAGDVGTSVDVTCTRCGRTVLGGPETPHATFVCRTCRAGSQTTRAVLEILGWLAVLAALPAVIALLALPTILGFTAGWVTYVWLAVLVFSALVAWGIYDTRRRP